MALTDAEQNEVLINSRTTVAFIDEIRTPQPRNMDKRWLGILPRLDDVPLFITELKGSGRFPWSNVLGRLSSFLTSQGK